MRGAIMPGHRDVARERLVRAHSGFLEATRRDSLGARNLLRSTGPLSTIWQNEFRVPKKICDARGSLAGGGGDDFSQRLAASSVSVVPIGTRGNLRFFPALTTVAYGNGGFVAVVANGTILESDSIIHIG